MTSWTDLKARSRQALHGYMGRPAHFYATAGASTFAEITVRVHTKDEPNGDLAGTNLSYAETAERPPRLIFWNAELIAAGISLDRGVHVTLQGIGGQHDEGYHVESVEPPDGQTTTCESTPLSVSELATLTTPGEGFIPPAETSLPLEEDW